MGYNDGRVKIEGRLLRGDMLMDADCELGRYSGQTCQI